MLAAWEGSTIFAAVKIILNTIGILPVSDRAAVSLASELLMPYLLARPTHQFVIILPRGSKFTFPDNIPCQIIEIHPPKRLWIKRWWLPIKLAALVRKQKADLLIQLSGYTLSHASVPQITLLQDYTLPGKKYTKAMDTMLARSAKANGLLVLSKAFGAYLTEKRGMAAGNIMLLPVFAPMLPGPASLEAKTNFKAEHTGGAEYFLCKVDELVTEQWLLLLKAYSLFKKRSRSAMQLVVVAAGEPNAAEKQMLETYRYRGDVRWVNSSHSGHLTEWYCAAYAWVEATAFRHLNMALLKALQCGVPVIAPRIPHMEEIGGNAFLYYTPNSLEDLADKMMLLYKDETLRSRLAANATGRIDPQAMQNCFTQLDTVICSVTSKL